MQIVFVLPDDTKSELQVESPGVLVQLERLQPHPKVSSRSVVADTQQNVLAYPSVLKCWVNQQ
jgi:hypothetical protein